MGGKVDYHIHTWFSDGAASPASIVEQAKEHGYEKIAITDHDGTDGVKEALEAGKKAGLEVIPGIELATETRDGVGLHILGYYIDIQNKLLKETLDDLKSKRETRNKRLLRLLADMGYPLSGEDLQMRPEQNFIGKPVIARALVKKGYISKPKDAFKKGVLLDSKEDAREVVKQVTDQYRNEKTVHAQIEEKTALREMTLKNGAKKPEILTVEEAAEAITSGREMTVRTTEVVKEKEPITFKRVVEKTDELFEGQSIIKRKGKEGRKEVTRKVTRENGRMVEETVLEEKLLKKARAEVTLAGTAEAPVPIAVSESSRQKGNGSLAAPLTSIKVTSGFGPRWGRTHLGVDLGMPAGEPVLASDSGTVIFSGYSGSYGNLVKLDHGNGMVTYYAHCSSLLVSQGQSVEKGQTIAQVGSTGNSTGPHLHFEVRINGQNVDPMGYF